MPATFCQRRPFARRRPAGTFSMLIRAGLALRIMMLPAPALAGSALPKGFVYLRDLDPTIVQDIRYAGSHNFVGRPIRGYLAAECILAQPAANALVDVQRKLAERNKDHVLDPHLEEQFGAGRLLAVIASRPGQCGRCDGYILEGKELEFYQKKLLRRKGAAQA